MAENKSKELAPSKAINYPHNIQIFESHNVVTFHSVARDILITITYIRLFQKWLSYSLADTGTEKTLGTVILTEW